MKLLLLLLILHTSQSQEQPADNQLTDDINAKLKEALESSIQPLTLDEESLNTLDELDIDTSAYKPGHSKEQANEQQLTGDTEHSLDILDHLPRPVKFINNYLLNNKPVLIRGAIGKSPAIRSWDHNYLSNAPPAVLAKVKVSTGQGKTTMNLRQFIEAEAVENFYMLDEVPSFLQKDVQFPNFLKCDNIMTGLLSHEMVYYKQAVAIPPRQHKSADSLVCVLRGQQKHVLVSGEDNLEYKDGGDWLNDVRNYREIDGVNPGDCIYIPHQWFDQVTFTSDESVSLTLTWEVCASGKASRSSCGQWKTDTDEPLSNFKFKQASRQREMIKDALIHYFMFYLGENLSGSFKHKQFIRKIKRDKELFGKQDLDWTDELYDIATELFETLDVNDDKIFSLSDVSQISFQMRDKMISEISDRLQDVGYITERQRQAKRVPSLAGKAASTAGMDGAFAADLQMEMDKMLADLETEAKNTGKPKDERKKERPKIKEKQKQKKISKQQVEEEVQLSDDENYEIVEDIEEEILAEEEEITPQNSRQETSKHGTEVNNNKKSKTASKVKKHSGDSAQDKKKSNRKSHNKEEL